MTKTKATKKLTDISFEHEGAAIALVSAAQGGPANGLTKTLQMKATAGFSQETIQKAQQIQVTMDIPEFLQKFFGLYYTDSHVLARLMGYEPPEEEEYEPWSETSYIDEKVQSFTILKSMQSGNHVTQLAALSETDYLQFLEDQAMLEGVMKQVAEKPTKRVAKKSKETKPKGELMTQEVDEGQVAVIQKALDDQKVELQKALEQVAEFKELQKAAVIKAKTDKVNAVVKDVEHQAVIAKAAMSMEAEDFDAFLAVVSTLQKQVQASEMFIEKGLQSSVDKPVESPMEALIKAKYNK
jgi:DNA-binding PucR family transcriptional regulator